MKIAITGYNGFIGSHLHMNLINKYSYPKENIILIEKNDFNSSSILSNKFMDCEMIFHFAGINRHRDLNYLFNENIRLTEKIIKNISIRTKTIIFASSTQQDLNNPFGKSKIRSSFIFKEWAIENGLSFINLKIPNVFGPFGRPNYNSVVSTFCNNITSNIKSTVNSGNELSLLYIDDLIDFLFNNIIKVSIKEKKMQILEFSEFPNVGKITVDKLYKILEKQWSTYKSNTVPNISDKFERNLFNTLRSFISYPEYFPRKLLKHIDERGFFSEILRTKGMGQFSISSTETGITRGNHFHTRKIERFTVIKGKAQVELRKVGSNKKLKFILNGDNLEFIDIPIWYTHNIKNVGNELLLTLFWINEPYDSKNSDTYFQPV
tara:strand:+ start:1134 stop:2267 length:1134 start_codon:yes stop_codon:yes gene_type:complete